MNIETIERAITAETMRELGASLIARAKEISDGLTIKAERIEAAPAPTPAPQPTLSEWMGPSAADLFAADRPKEASEGKHRTRWTKEEDEIVLNYAINDKEGPNKVAAILRRTPKAIECRRWVLFGPGGGYKKCGKRNR